MNDFEFGNYIYEMRKKSGLTQNELAKEIGISNKAISKWENGKSKPTTDVLRKLSVLWNVPVENLLMLKEKEKDMEITKIVITGGSCAGKSTALSWIQNAFTQKGYQVLIVPETATELILGGVAPWTCGTNLDFQKCQMELQLEKEKLFEQAATSMDSKKILIICDRGALDNKAYMTPSEFSAVLNSLGKNEIELRDGYNAVFHLVSAAKGAESFYTTANNNARTEDLKQAAELDDKIISSWTGHPHFRIIDNQVDF